VGPSRQQQPGCREHDHGCRSDETERT
jgi:hypothetical protein